MATEMADGIEMAAETEIMAVVVVVSLLIHMFVNDRLIKDMEVAMNGHDSHVRNSHRAATSHRQNRLQVYYCRPDIKITK